VIGVFGHQLAFAFSPIPNLTAILRTECGLRPARLTISSKDFDVAAISSNRRWSAKDHRLIFFFALGPVSTIKLTGPVDGRVLKPSPDHLLAQLVCPLANARACRQMVLMPSIFVRLLADAFVIKREAFIRNSIQTHNTLPHYFFTLGLRP
jgi:hypothetical protein